MSDTSTTTKINKDDAKLVLIESLEKLLEEVKSKEVREMDWLVQHHYKVKEHWYLPSSIEPLPGKTITISILFNHSSQPTIIRDE